MVTFVVAMGFIFNFITSLFCTVIDFIFRPLPALKTGALDTGILISSLVVGLRPLRAARCLVSKVPNPTSTTFLHELNSP